MFSKTGRLHIGGKHIEEGLDSENIEIGFDEESQSYYAIYKLIALGLGKTKEDALEDLREAAHFGVDTLRNVKSDNRKHKIKTVKTYQRS